LGDHWIATLDSGAVSTWMTPLWTPFPSFALTMTKVASAGREPTVPGSWDRPGQSSVPERPDAPETPGQLLREPSRDVDGAEPADRLATGDPPPRWSRADLQQRLERLPAGHPSSPESEKPEPQLSSQATDTHRDDQPDTERQGEPDAPKRDYWSEVPRFLQAASDHQNSWSNDRTAIGVDRSHDPPGSWRGDGNQYLDPDQHVRAQDTITRICRKEEELTKDLRKADQDPSCDGWLVGLENRIKGEERIKEKIGELLKRMPDRTVEDVAHELPDTIRYTFCFLSERYTDGYWQIKDRMESSGHSMIYSKNHWSGNLEYRGVNTRWMTGDGQRFEIQFHTAESLHAKQDLTHGTYERLRNPLTPDDERQNLRSFQKEVCSWVGVPRGATAIPDYNRKGQA